MRLFKFFNTRRRRLLAGIVFFALIATTVVLAGPGDTITAPIVAPGFNFELESPPGSLKDVPIWDELEQMLNDPYAIQYADPRLAEEVGGFPSYEATITRRRSYLPAGCTYQTPVPAGLVACDDSLLEPFLVHPLNYNHMNGEELRLLNPNYPGGEFDIPVELIQCGVGNPDESAFCAEATQAYSIDGPVDSPANDPNRWVWVYETVDVSPGEERVEETSIDFNSPMRPDVETPNNTTYPPTYDNLVCIVSTEATPAEGAILCGGDPGIPGYVGFGVYDPESYSTPAIRGVASADTPISLPISGDSRLFDPGGCAERNEVSPGSCDGDGFINWLLRPTVRETPDSEPDFIQNSVENLEANGADSLVASNENDYVRDRDAAILLGKAFFWDMQVGSDGVQACGSCHFSAGADDRTKNQVNPNHLGGDVDFEVAQPNEEVEAMDFPFALQETQFYNDVLSSMGVHWGVFQDIPAIGTFIPNASGVNVLPIDLRSDNVDPIPGFGGPSGTNDFRRVEPRNTPTMISAAFNFDNFWDGRARHDFNGGSVFGPSDPFAHVFACGSPNANEDNCQNPNQNFHATRQIIRNSSAASQATGPVLSEFEMSFFGRNWPKVGKKLLQGSLSSSGGVTRLVGSVTPLANQLVDTTDSVLGIYSNQGGSACGALPAYDRSPSWSAGGVAGRPGLCISYPALIREAFYPQLWATRNRHLEGAPDATDPFDGYSLTVVNGAANAFNTNQFTQMEANMSLFFGISVQIWETILIPDDAPFDRFMDANPDAFKSLGEANEPGLVWDMLECDQTDDQPCFTEVGPFKRDTGVPLNLETGPGVTTGTRQPGDPDPLLGFDFFYGFNLSGKNPEFRTARCGECHAGGNTTDHTMTTSNQLGIGDFVAEFSIPGIEIPIEPLGRGRTISGFALEGELGENAQDAIERRIINQSLIPDPVDGLSYPDGQAFFDNGMYNLGVTPIANDLSRGGDDPFGFPLSLAKLMLWNLGGIGLDPGIPLSNFDPDLGSTGGLYEESAQDQQINPGHEEEPAEPMLPAFLAPWASNTPVGDEIQQDEVGGGGAGMVNTYQEVPLLEGFIDTLGPFNPAGTIGETYNMAPEVLMGTWPVVNRVGFMGSFKAPSIRNAELTGPYFHNGGKLTLGQVIAFYERGGDFPDTNAAHRDFNIVDLRADGQSLGGLDPAVQDEFIRSLVDFLLTFTDDRVRNEQAPFDHPEMFVPLDGTAPENTFGRPGFQALTTGDCGSMPGAGPCFLHVPAVGAGGLPILGLPPVDGFLGVEVGDRNNPNCSVAAGPISHYCVDILP